MPSEVILASSSVYRRALLERLGIPFRCVAPADQEEKYKLRGLAPRVLAEELARAKAESVARQFPSAIVIGSDQLATIDGQVLGKPGTPENAIDQLALLAGRTHELVTAVYLVGPVENVAFQNITRLTMRPLSSEQIARYVARDRPLDCAGSYKIEAAGIMLFERIETDDFSAITGLPLIQLTSALGQMGVCLP